MPNSELGRLLNDSVPPSPIILDPSSIVLRARRRRGLRGAGLMAALAIAVSGAALVAASVAGGPSASAPSPPATKAIATVHSTVTPTVAPPHVVGLGVDQASSRIRDGQCTVAAEHIVNQPGTHVGQVLDQQVVSAYCEVALTVSAGPPANAVPACHSLAARQGGEGGGLGNYGVSLIFRNIGPTPCALDGYPDLTAREQGANMTIAARHTPLGYIGGTAEPLPTYVLLPGDEVSALFEETDNPTAGYTCPMLIDFRVTAGGLTTTLPVRGSNCSGIEIHPYVPGSFGSAP